MGMPQHMESDCRDNAGPLADFTHSTQLFGAFPAASVIALEQHVGGGTAADQPIHQLRCLASESVNYFTLGGEKICEPYRRQARWGMHMLAWMITVVVAIGLVWSFVAMSELLPVVSDSVAISRPAK